MARRNKKKKRSRPESDSPDQKQADKTSSSLTGSASLVASPITAPPHIRLLFVLVGVAVAGWLVFLGSVAALTANPVTLNIVQISNAQLIVAATVTDFDQNTVKVEQVWGNQGELNLLILDNLKETGAKPGRQYLIPVSRSGNGRFSVTTTYLPGNLPLIYPHTPEAVRQLTLLLEKNQQAGQESASQ